MSNRKKIGLFVSVNPELQSQAGHPFHLDLALKSAAEDSGLRFLSFGSKNPGDEIRSLEFVEPVFSSNSWEVFQDGTSEIVEQHVQEFVEALDDLKKTVSGDDQILVYWYMGSAEVFRELSRHADSFGNVVFCLHLFSGFFFAPGSFASAHLLHAGLLLEQMQEAKFRYEVVSDSEKLVRDLNEVTGASCRIVPAFASQRMVSDGKSSPVGERITVVYPTDDSTPRGFELLTGFLSEHSVGYRDSIDFKIRMFPGNRKGIKESLEEISDNIEFVEGELSNEQFQSLLSEADIVILPYLKELFYYRTSSILYEAWALKKPVVVVNDTWLSDSVDSMGGGWVADESSDGMKKVFDLIVSDGKRGIEAKAEEITTIPHVEDLFATIVALPFDGIEKVSFTRRLTSDAVEEYYESEKEKTRIRRKLEEARFEIARLERKEDWLESELHRIVNSKTWRYTESVRGWAESVKDWRRGSKPA